MQNTTKNIFVELIEQTEKNIGKTIFSVPHKSKLGTIYNCLEQEYKIDSDQEIILLEVPDEFFTTTINLTKGEVSGFGIEGREYDKNMLNEVKSLGHEILDKISIFNAF